MEALFFRLWNMSVVAGWVILAVMILRLLLRRAPRAISCFLWGLVGIRLICPISYESQFSLIPDRAVQYEEVLNIGEGSAGYGSEAADQKGNMFLTDMSEKGEESSADPQQLLVRIGTPLWLAGMISMLLYAGISSLRLRRQVAAAMRLGEYNASEAWQLSYSIWICDRVKSPFILGMIRPRIYLPSQLEPSGRGCIMEHEKAHLKRGDHFWKPMGFLLLSVYWFQPLCWVAYILLCRDIELACDERVVREMTAEEKKGYAETLLSCSVQQHRVTACPLAFGEVGVKDRVKGVLYYKKPAFWIGIAAAGVCIAAAVCFLTNPLDKDWRKGKYDTEELTAMLREMSGSDAEIFAVYESETIPGTLLAGYRCSGNKMGLAIYGWIKDEEAGGYYWIRGYQDLGSELLESSTIGADWGIDRSVTVVLSNEGELSHISAQIVGEFQEIQAETTGGPAMYVMEWNKLVKSDSVDIRYFDDSGSELRVVDVCAPVELEWWEEEDVPLYYEEELDWMELEIRQMEEVPEDWEGTSGTESVIPVSVR